MVEILTPASSTELDHVRSLIRSFLAWHRERHDEDRELIDSYFDADEFEAELATLPGAYGPPDGALRLALVDGEPAGCVALRRLDSEACEMKRMFLHARYQGQGIGRALGEAILEAGRAAGYRVMRLDTSWRQAEAQALYQRLGFQRTDPYYPLPESLRAWLVFFEREL
jgi:GNAT superfamily N-acetyltransferase